MCKVVPFAYFTPPYYTPPASYFTPSMPGGPLGSYLARARHARRPQTSPPLRGLRAGGHRCWLTKTGFGGATTLQMRWLIVRIYALEGVRGWNKVARRFRTLAPTSQRSRQTCARIVRLWLRTGDVWPAHRKAVRSRGRHVPELSPGAS